MAIRIVNLHTVLDFVWSKDPDKGTDQQTKFQFRPLDAYEQAYLQDRVSSVEKMPAGMQDVDPNNAAAVKAAMAQVRTRSEVHRVAIDAVRIACTGFDNLLDDKDEPVKFDQEHGNIAGKAKLLLADGIVKMLPIVMLVEFYMTIMGASVVSTSAGKNSDKD